MEVLFAAPQPVGPAGVGGAGESPSLNEDRALRDLLELATVTTLIQGDHRVRAACRRGPGGGTAAAVFR